MGTIADKTSALANTKADIKAALQEQGQQVSDVFSTYGDAIRAIAPGVSSFNGRTGEVTPGSDDYSAGMIKFTDGQTFQQKYDAGQLTGPQGPAGSNGQDGSPGQNGADGEDGGYYQPSVDGSGNLTWTASKPGMPAVSGANIKGATGPAGTNGKDATINGVNALTLEVVEGAGIVGKQTGDTFKIDATELFQSVSDGKTAIAAAITDKGVATAADATFQQMATNIGQIETNGSVIEVNYLDFWDNIGDDRNYSVLFCFSNFFSNFIVNITDGVKYQNVRIEEYNAELNVTFDGETIYVTEVNSGLPVMKISFGYDGGYYYEQNDVLPEEPQLRYFIM